MAAATVIIIFLSFRILDLAIAAFAPYFIKYLGFFPYKELLDLSFMPHFFSAFGNFDGVHYVRISEHGYDNYEQAYFPLYPLIIRFASPIFSGNTVVTGIFLSWFLGAAGLVFFTKYLGAIGLKRQQILWAVIFMCVYPASFFFGALYGESLFLFLTALALYSIKRKLYFFAVLVAAFASFSRLAGIFLVLPHIVELWPQKSQFSENIKRLLSLKNLIIIVSPLIGLLCYMTYLSLTTGDPVYFFTVQPVFGAYRSTHIIMLPQVVFRYLRIFITANQDFRYYVSLLEFITFSIMFGAVLWEFYSLWRNKIKKEKLSRLGLALFSASYLILPTLTGTFSSMPRYSLMALSAYLVFSAIKPGFLKYALAVVFAVLHVIVLGFFIQGYFVG